MYRGEYSKVFMCVCMCVLCMCVCFCVCVCVSGVLTHSMCVVSHRYPSLEVLDGLEHPIFYLNFCDFLETEKGS